MREGPVSFGGPGPCFQLRNQIQTIGGFHVDDSTYRSCVVAGGSLTRMAVQQIVGLLPEWRAWLGGCGPACAAARRPVVKPESLDRFFVKPMPS